MALLPWPGNSSDMNPIEHVWDYIGKQIQNCTFKSVDELFEKVKLEWSKIHMEYIKKLYASMNRCV